MYHLDVLFHFHVHIGSKLSSLFGTAANQVPAWYSSSVSALQAKTALLLIMLVSAADVYRDIDIFGTRTLSLDHVL
jgi:hypothetical protein